MLAASPFREPSATPPSVVIKLGSSGFVVGDKD
jgi:hypothetical protein